jgi:hypothetical protein
MPKIPTIASSDRDHINADYRIWFYAERVQIMGKLIRAIVQFSVGQTLAFKLHRNSLRGFRSLRFK